jgi:hypothetical protein
LCSNQAAQNLDFILDREDGGMHGELRDELQGGTEMDVSRRQAALLPDPQRRCEGLKAGARCRSARSLPG